MEAHDGECQFCKSKDIRLDAGFYFCNNCGAEQQGRRETEHELSYAKRVGHILRKPKDKKDEEREQRQHQKVRKLREDPHLCERALADEDYPRWMDSVGARLCTASKLVVKCAHVMTSQFGVPSQCVELSQKLFYTYLKKAGIAFCAEETTDNPAQAFCPLVKRTTLEIAKLKGQKKREVRQRKKQKRKEKLEQSSIWEQIVDEDDQDEAEGKLNKTAKAGSDEEEEEVEILQRIATSLSVRAVNMACSIYLGVDLLLCIVHLASQMCGCQWIQLSDIFRWYREGRFDISYSQLCALNFSTTWTEAHQQPHSAVAMQASERRFFHRSVYDCAYLAIQPTSESNRVLAFMTQFIGIPRSIHSMDFTKVLARLIYNLNLPRAFLRHLLAISAKLLPINTEFGADYFANTMPIDSGLCERLSWISNRNRKMGGTNGGGILGYVSFFRRAFLANHSQLPWKAVDLKGIDKTGKMHFISLPLEVKAAALILFALKLFFGLDGHREHLIRPRTTQHSGPDHEQRGEPFNFINWLTQLELRTHCWQGTPADTVLVKGFFSDQMERSNPDIGVRREQSNNVGRHPGHRLFGHYRFVNFPGCVPNINYNEAQPLLFQRLFPEQFQPPSSKLLSKDGKETLLTPLASQAITNAALLKQQAANTDDNDEEDDGDLDKHNVRTFFTRFYDTHLELEMPRDGQEEGNAVGNNTKNTFLRLFPTANAYTRLPIPSMRCMALVVPERDDHGFVHDVVQSEDFQNFPALPMTPVLSYKELKAALISCEPLMSTTFRSLLRHLSLAVSEMDHVLLFAFLMVEAMFFDRANIARMERDLRDHGRVMFSSLMPTHGGQTMRFRYTLYLSGPNAADEEEHRQRAKTHEFRYKIARRKVQKKGRTKELVVDMDKNEQQGFQQERLEKFHQKLTFHNLQEPIPAADEAEVTTPILGEEDQDQRNLLERREEEAPATTGESQNNDESDTNDSDIEEEENVDVAGGPIASFSMSSSSSSSSSLESDIDEAPAGAGQTGRRRRRRRRGERYPVKMISLPAPASLALCSFSHW